MQKLSYVELTGFRSFRKRCRIEFPEKGLLRLKGNNHDTGGESAAGKSTIPLAIAFAFGKCPFPATELQSWDSEKAPQVVLGLRDGTVIDRGKKFAITKNDGTIVEGSAAQREEWLTSYFGGLDGDIIQALTYRGQRTPGLFLSKTDSYKKEFLTRLLKLDRFEKVVEDGNKTITVLESVSARALGAYESLAKALADLGTPPNTDALLGEEEVHKERLSTLQVAATLLHASMGTLRSKAQEDQEAITAKHRDAIKLAHQKVVELQQVLPAFQAPETEYAKFKATSVQCNDRLARLLSEDRAQQAAMDQDRNQIVARISGLETAGGALKGHERELERLKLEFSAMTTDICPTCKREWDLAEEKRKDLRVRYASEEALANTCKRCQAEAQALRNEFDLLPKFEPDPTIAKLQQALADLQAKMAVESQKVESAKKLHEAESRKLLAEARTDEAVLVTNRDAEFHEVAIQLDLKIREVQRRIDARTEETAQVRAELNQVQRDMIQGKGHHEQYSKLQVLVEKSKGEYDAAEAKVRVEKDFLGLIGREGFLGSIFDEVLAEISDETNQLLASVANTRHCTIRFSSETVTQKGTIRKEIKPVVTINGHEAPLASGASGGMISVIELAVDLALGAVISRRSGVCPSWLILDEAFDGLGAVEKDSALEILQKYAQDRLLIVIDHSSEIKGAFTQTIEIHFENGESWV